MIVNRNTVFLRNICMRNRRGFLTQKISNIICAILKRTQKNRQDKIMKKINTLSLNPKISEVEINIIRDFFMNFLLLGTQEEKEKFCNDLKRIFYINKEIKIKPTDIFKTKSAPLLSKLKVESFNFKVNVISKNEDGSVNFIVFSEETFEYLNESVLFRYLAFISQYSEYKVKKIIFYDIIKIKREEFDFTEKLNKIDIFFKKPNLEKFCFLEEIKDIFLKKFTLKPSLHYCSFCCFLFDKKDSFCPEGFHLLEQNKTI